MNKLYWRSNWNFQCLNLIYAGKTVLKRLQKCCSVLSERNKTFVRIQKDKRTPNLCSTKVQSSKVWGKSWIHSASHTLDPPRLVFYSASSLCCICVCSALSLSERKCNLCKQIRFLLFKESVFSPSALKESCFSFCEVSLSVICRATLCLPKVQPLQLQKQVEKHCF